LTKSVIDLAAAHLKRQFVYQTQRGRFGSLNALVELAISARGCVATSMSSSRVMVAFVLERVLDQSAGELSGRPMTISEIAELGARFHEPVWRAIEYLTGADDDPIDIATGLIKARSATQS
jgi:hypothetical protein